MSSRTIYLIPDTNLFLQCSLLGEINWASSSDLTDCSEIHLIVCNPVLREIDRLKSRGRDRVQRRARKVSSIFRHIIINENGVREIRPSSPRVRLVLSAETRPTPELNDGIRLDYSNPDDEIIGCLDGFLNENSDVDVRLLTHDGGPMLTCQGLGFSFVPIPDAWLLPPESSEMEKAVQRLKEENLRLRRAEPDFEISLINEGGVAVDSILAHWRVYEPLSDEEIADFIDLIQSRFPMANNFEAGNSESRNPRPPGLTLRALSKQFIPPSRDEIERYESEYSAWLDECERLLSTLHERLTDINAPSFCLAATNVGSRPGRDALLEMTALGPFLIRPPIEVEMPERTLSPPPKPPEGRWTSITEALLFPHRELIGPSYPLVSKIDRRRDPNAFYYRPLRPEEPVSSFSLECEQWRHGDQVEEFFGHMFFNGKVGRENGALKCVIQAENLSDPVQITDPVRFEIEKASTKEEAVRLVAQIEIATETSA